MATEGIFPKTGGDILYASEVNNFRMFYKRNTFTGSITLASGAGFVDAGSTTISGTLISGCLINANFDFSFTDMSANGVHGAYGFISGANTGNWCIGLSHLGQEQNQVSGLNGVAIQSGNIPAVNAGPGAFKAFTQFGNGGFNYRIPVPAGFPLKDNIVVMGFRAKTDGSGQFVPAQIRAFYGRNCLDES